ncbi:hypothetical protein A3F06_03200 [candidate division TM6 bacterium RIFCSPHIGHO2_12_FULL_36_22]|nr:MAG: hypothetical protein A3F06_03200 [candidate division TM6 bacterium RIFCSPHIGHO2_12_FULL_36_22]
MKNRQVILILMSLLFVCHMDADGPWYRSFNWQNSWTASVSGGWSRSWTTVKNYSAPSLLYCYAWGMSGGSRVVEIGGPFVSYLNPTSYFSTSRLMERLKARFFPNDLNEDLIAAMQKNSRQRETEVKKLLDRGADANYENRPPIVVAAEQTSLPLARIVNSHGLTDIDQRHPESRVTALMIAAGKQDRPMLEYLLFNGASLEIVDSCGRTPLVHGIEGGFLKGLRQLATQTNVNRGDLKNRTPVFKAAELKRLDMVMELFKLELDVDPNLVDALDRSALMCSLHCKDKKMAEFLHKKGALVGDRERTMFEGNGWEKDLARWQRADVKRADVISDQENEESDDRWWWERTLFPIPPSSSGSRLSSRSSSCSSFVSFSGSDSPRSDSPILEIITPGVRQANLNLIEN